jgi:ATP-dependent DNA helicase RecG
VNYPNSNYAYAYNKYVRLGMMEEKDLYYLFLPIESLPKVTTRIKSLLSKLLHGLELVDLAFHLPTNITHRKLIKNLSEACPGENIIVKVKVGQHISSFKRRAPYKVQCLTEEGEGVELSFFNGNRNYLQSVLPEGDTRLISGKYEIYRNIPQISHPDYILGEKQAKKICQTEVIYPLTANINNKFIAELISEVVKNLPDLPEWLDEEMQKKHEFQSWKQSLTAIHKPQKAEDIDINTIYRRRLAYDEFLAMQLALQILRRKHQKETGNIISGHGGLRQKALVNFGFQLTACQQNALVEIYDNQAANTRMFRLLQGDVGSGKTIVAMLSALNVVETGKQAAIMAPTAILAEQHYAFFSKIAQDLDLNIVLLTGRLKVKEKKEILAKIASGEADIIIGTHSLFFDKVKFKNLGLAIIDEQHRFGIKQRSELAEKGDKADILLMSATPIPRTLALTFYGDMQISFLQEKPAGRLEIDTRIISLERLAEVAGAVQRAISKGEKIYWVCPLIDESEKSDLAAATSRYEDFCKMFAKEKVGLMHGKMKADEKEKILQEFIQGKILILVSTTVIEVGIDVSDATIMVIEHAERFGLSQLHQLRGRVGRSDKKSSCVLLYEKHPQTSNATIARLKIMRETNDGFKIAEEDLKIRGAGELIGRRQSGLPNFKIASLSDHYDLFKIATKDAQFILERDANLTSERGRHLRNLLQIFRYKSEILFKV